MGKSHKGSRINTRDWRSLVPKKYEPDLSSLDFYLRKWLVAFVIARGRNTTGTVLEQGTMVRQ